MASFRLGVDVGGTFTDFVLFNEKNSETAVRKVPTTPSRLSEGVLNGIKSFGVNLSEISQIMHGTTVGLNAVIQRAGAKTGLLATEGFSDVLEIGDMAKLDMYDLFYQKAKPLVAREFAVGISERTAGNGDILKSVDLEQAVREVGRLRNEGITSIAVCFLNSYLNPSNEQACARAIEESYPDLHVSVSSQIVRQRNEIYRASTVAINAYIAPILDEYLSDLHGKLERDGFNGTLYIMSSNGGVMTARKASKNPVYTLLSGPVGGIVGGQSLGAKIGAENVITFDMGGTSCDISVIIDSIPEITHEARVAGHRTLTAALNVNYLGAGGGSVARIVGENSLRVGPDSVGATPGPACYAFGGMSATVTDANLVLGRLDTDIPLAGGITLDANLAREAIRVNIAEKLGLSVEEAALGILKIACNNMALAIREVTVQQGVDPRQFALIAFGGAGPMHACEVAQAIGISRVVVPLSPGNFCAWGMLNTDIRHDLVRTLPPSNDNGISVLNRTLAALEKEGLGAIVAEAVSDEKTSVKRLADMRYKGQDHTLPIQLPEGLQVGEVIAAARKTFDSLHLRKYGHNSLRDEIEIINARVEITGQMPRVTFGDFHSSGESHKNQSRKVIFEDGAHETPVLERLSLGPGSRIDGPVIVSEPGATTVLPPGSQMIVGRSGELVIDLNVVRESKPVAPKMKGARVLSEPDAITVEVVRNALVAIAEEMSAGIQRSAHNWIITKGKDHSTGIYGPDSSTYAQSQGLPEFVCDIPTAIRSIIEDIGGVEHLKDGDIYLTNDPYATTLHVNDVNAIKPVFYDDELIGFCAARVHWHDIGGAVRAGNMNATEVFQEGLILRSIRIMESGVLDRNVISIISENNRIPEHTIGDLNAELGACSVGEQRFKELINRYGLPTFKASVNQILRNGEIQASEALAKIPEGVYEASSCLDNDGVDLDTPLPVKVKLIVKDGLMTFDLSGSAESCRGPMHCSANLTGSICRMVFKMLTTAREAANEGHFRMVRVLIPERSIFRAKKPQATLPGFFALEALLDCAKRALAPAVPWAVNADDYGKCTPAHIAFLTPQGEYLFLPDTEGGGWGAKPFEDGENALRFNPGPIVSTEDHESKFPVRLRQYVLRQDSGGPGMYRGGLGIIKDYEALVDCSFNAGLDRQVCPPQGVLGGGKALGQRLVIKKPDGTEQRLPSKVSNYPVKRGEIISFQTAGGGGYGDARKRGIAAVESDLRKGYVSADYAEKNYGVVVNRVTLKVTRGTTADHQSGAEAIECR